VTDLFAQGYILCSGKESGELRQHAQLNHVERERGAARGEVGEGPGGLELERWAVVEAEELDEARNDAGRDHLAQGRVLDREELPELGHALELLLWVFGSNCRNQASHRLARQTKVGHFSLWLGVGDPPLGFVYWGTPALVLEADLFLEEIEFLLTYTKFHTF
jgi:hypothetical protein